MLIIQFAKINSKKMNNNNAVKVYFTLAAALTSANVKG